MLSISPFLVAAWPRLPPNVAQVAADAVAAALQRATFDSSVLDALDGRGAIAEFEAAFAPHVAGRQVVATSSGAAALHLALLAAGVGQGDEVLLPAYGWGQILTFVDALGAVPVFADVSADTMTLCPRNVAERISSRTRAIVVVHAFGLPAAMADLKALAESANALLIEDCAQALGASWHEQPVGTLGDIGVFSFGPRKHLPCGEGGALVTGDPLLAGRAIVAGQHPDRAAWQNSDPRLNVTEFFWPYRMHPLCAVLGSALLPFAEGWNAARQRNHARLCEALRVLPDVEVLQPSPTTQGAWHGLALRWNGTPEKREIWVQSLKSRGIILSAGMGREPLHRRAEIVARWGEQPPCLVAEQFCDGQELYWCESIGLIEQDDALIEQIIEAFCNSPT